jgi:hypothetical protein
VPLAVARAVWWHAAAGQLAGARAAERATTSDLLAAIGPLLGLLAATTGDQARDEPQPAGGVLPWDAWRERHLRHAHPGGGA